MRAQSEVQQPPASVGRPSARRHDDTQHDDTHGHGESQSLDRGVVRDAEDDQNDGHDCEGRQEGVLGSVEASKGLTPMEGSVVVAVADDSPRPHGELIAACEAEKTSDDGEVKACGR